MNRAQRRAAARRGEAVEIGLARNALVDGERRRVAAQRAQLPDWATIADFDEMDATSGPAMAFETVKTSVQPGLTFSHEAMNALAVNMATWVASRVTRYWRETGRAPTKMRVVVHAVPEAE
jgi:hypothetical protein